MTREPEIKRVPGVMALYRQMKSPNEVFCNNRSYDL
jgi:hypothetical protein